MKSLLFIAIIILAGCTGSSDFFESLVPDGAKERYEEAGGNAMVFTDINATAPVTVTPTIEGNYVTFPLPGDCRMYWDVQAIDPIHYLFWLAQPMTITYDANLFRCNANFYCSGIGTMVGTVAEVDVTCEELP